MGSDSGFLCGSISVFLEFCATTHALGQKREVLDRKVSLFCCEFCSGRTVKLLHIFRYDIIVVRWVSRARLLSADYETPTLSELRFARSPCRCTDEWGSDEVRIRNLQGSWRFNLTIVVAYHVLRSVFLAAVVLDISISLSQLRRL